MFIPLHINSCYTILGSNLTIEKIIQNAQINNLPSIALTDLNSLIASISFFQEAKAKNIKPIIGLDLKINDNLFTFLVKNENGYHNLLQIFRLFNLKQLNLDECRKYSDGIIVVISSKESNLIDKFKKSSDKLNDDLQKYQNIFQEFYIGVEIYNTIEKETFKKIRNFLKNKKHQLIAFPLIRYEKKEDEMVYQILQAIKKKQKIPENETKKIGFNYFYTAKEIENLYEIEEINSTEIIAQSINFNLLIKRNNAVHFSENDDENLKKISYQLIKEKIPVLNDIYLNRLNYELNVVQSMHFSNYFLIAMDYINFAKKNNIYVGPGRGSIGGSLIAYVLGITTIDPVKEKLIFERFLNLERKNMPDIDVDFEDIEREKIIQYIETKYNKEHVANIATIQNIKSKQAIRDIGNVYSIKNYHIDFLCKKIKDESLIQNYLHNQEFKKIIDQDSYFKFIFEMASKIENLPRQLCVHAAGIIIDGKPLNCSLPIYVNNSHNLIGITKDDLETIGFVKLDILGLKNLNIIKNIIEDIQKNQNILINYETIPYEDPKSIKLIQDCHTDGLFQLESSKINQIIKYFKPNNFNDVVDLISICRPGPIKFIQKFINQKNNPHKIDFCHTRITHILKPTHGIILYQEQIIEIINIVTKLSFSDSDLFRREMLKNNHDISLKQKFIEKAINNDFSEKESNQIFEFILQFCNYGFNKSHAFAYAKLSCQMAYLKAHYPLFFYKTLLNKDDNIDFFIEMYKNKIYLHSPNINYSGCEYVLNENKIFFPLDKIKGISKSIIWNILEERKKNTYENFIDFVTRNIQNIHTETIKILINAGCFDCFDTRSNLLNSLDDIIKFAQLTYNLKNKNLIEKPIIKKINSAKYSIFDDLIQEFYSLGLILTKKFISFCQNIREKENTLFITEVKRNREAKIDKILGIVEKINYVKNNKSIIITINDGIESIDVIFFDDLYQKIKNKLDSTSNHGIILIKGIYNHKYQTFKCVNLMKFYEKIDNN